MCVWERTIQQVFSSKSCVFSSFWWWRSHRSTNCCRRPTVQMDVLYLANLPPVNNTSWQGYNEYPKLRKRSEELETSVSFTSTKNIFRAKRFLYIYIYSLNESTLIKGSSACSVAMAFLFHFGFTVRAKRASQRLPLRLFGCRLSITSQVVSEKRMVRSN